MHGVRENICTNLKTMANTFGLKPILIIYKFNNLDF